MRLCSQRGRSRALAFAFSGCLASAGTGVQAVTPGVDIVLTDGNVITVDSERSIAQAVAIDGGRIVAVGDDALVLADAAARVIDLGGLTVMPGIVDPHLHVLQHDAISDDALVAIEQELIENGRTTVGTPGVQAEALEALRDFGASGRSRLRHHMYAAYNDFCDADLGTWYTELEYSRAPAQRTALAGIKLFSDGGACDAPAVSFDWETPRWTGDGDLFVDRREVADLVDTADRLGAQLVTHAAGDRALEATLDGLEAALDGGDNPNRHRIDHLMFARPDQLGRLGPLGVPPVLFGVHQSCLDTEDSRVIRYLGAGQVDWLEPRRAIIEANPQVPAAWHSDAPFMAVSIFDHLAALTGFGERLGQASGCESAALVEQQLTSHQAIAMMTIGGAYAMQLEDEIGSIEPGKAADLVVLARDPLPLDAEQHFDNSVVATIIDGSIEFCDRGLAAFCDPAMTPTEAPSGRVAARASAFLPGAEPAKARDGDHELGWMSGGDAPQWIEFDLGGPTHIAGLRLVVDQYPEGRTRHVIRGGARPDPTHQLAVVEGETFYGQVLQVDIDAEVRYLRVETVESPSWVSWLEVEVIEAPR